MRPRRIPYREFAQAVRRFHRDRLLEAVAVQSARTSLVGVRRITPPALPQFALATIARVALARPTTDRADVPVPYHKLHALCTMAMEVDQHDIPDRGVLFSPLMRRMLLRVFGQQDLFRHGEYGDLMRTLALLVEHDPAIRGLPTPDAWESALGVTLTEYVTVVFALHIAMDLAGGHLTTGELSEYVQAGAFGDLDLAAVQKLIADHLAADLPVLHEQARREEAAPAVRGYEMWSTNPLMDRPVIADNNGYRVPVSAYLRHKLTPLGLFFTGRDHFGKNFFGALGDSFEKLVGRHLALLGPAGAVVYPEITYGPKKARKKTVDHIVVLPEVVLLVEAKGMRSTAGARLGDEEALADLAGRIKAARDQIDVTAAAIRDRVPELAHIPDDRPVRGLLVTLEPIPLIDTYIFDDLLKEANIVESATVCAHDLEQALPALAQAPDPGARLLTALTFDDPTPAALSRAVQGLKPADNPIVTDLWDRWFASTPWPSKNQKADTTEAS